MSEPILWTYFSVLIAIQERFGIVVFDDEAHQVLKRADAAVEADVEP